MYVESKEKEQISYKETYYLARNKEDYINNLTMLNEEFLKKKKRRFKIFFSLLPSVFFIAILNTCFMVYFIIRAFQNQTKEGYVLISFNYYGEMVFELFLFAGSLIYLIIICIYYSYLILKTRKI